MFDTAKILVSELAARGLKITFAESCTGGLLSAALTAVPGCSAVFEGAVCSYSDRVKNKVLGVEGQVLDRFSAVSAQSAFQMARGALKLFSADIAVAVTGYAGPAERKKKKGKRKKRGVNGIFAADGDNKFPVGTVFICCLFGGKKSLRRCFFSGNRETVRKKAAEFALRLAYRSLTENKG